MNLHALGYGEQLAQLFAPYLAGGLVLARVVRAERGIYLVSDGERDFTAEVRGRLRHVAVRLADLPAVGDWVGLRPQSAAGPALIDVVLPRKNRFRRKVAGSRTDEQILAANIDWLWIVVGLDGDYSLRRIERYLTAAGDAATDVCIVLNKADGRPDAEAVADEVRRVADGRPVLALSAATGQGCGELAALLHPGLTFALVGSSGVGKSTLINRLLGVDRQPTAEVRSRDDRGCHTTSRRELVVMPDGPILMDTPGLRELALWADGSAPWHDVFGEIADLGRSCRYRDCSHEREPGCAVQAAVAAGEIDAGRLASFQKQRRELEHNAARQDQRAWQGRDESGRAIARAIRQLGKQRTKW
jgi:ribosome biogenesis GTPase